MKVDSVEVLAPSKRIGGGRSFELTATTLEVDGKKLACKRPTKNGEDVEILATARASDGDAIWAILSDTFAIAQGRFVARLTWSGSKAAWGPLKSPYPWSPYSHAGMFLESIGAATIETAFVTAFSESTAVLGRVGKHPHKGVPIARGTLGFGTSPASLLVLANRKFSFLDASGTERASFGFSGAVKKAIGSPTAIWHLGIAGRVISVTTREQLVRITLDEDPPALEIPSGKVTKPRVTETEGPYGALDPSRSRSPMVIAIERVQAWDLNETPAFGTPAPFAALIVQPDAVQFCRERDGRLRKSFDFMARAVTVAVAAAPKGTPKGIVLAKLRTPSGLTQVLCRDEFATLLAASTGPKRKR